jgi:hypothetical protein
MKHPNDQQMELQIQAIVSCIKPLPVWRRILAYLGF